jgi:hypothetical protein
MLVKHHDRQHLEDCYAVELTTDVIDSAEEEGLGLADDVAEVDDSPDSSDTDILPPLLQSLDEHWSEELPRETETVGGALD